MNNTRKFLSGAAIAAVLVLSSAGVAAAGCDEQPTPPVLGGNHSLPGGGTVCINEGSATAQGVVTGSPGVLSGNQIQIPINFQLNVCGNGLNVLGL
ncbi:chaplin [Kitasatospora sp. NPDC093806]|uniref:chaplin n=1 Tax=Kitasatospora sp. NPDC093806 TaxID=3155075 RepID=UPI00343BA98C